MKHSNQGKVLTGLLIVLMLVVGSKHSAIAQGAFSNLDFESALLPPNPGEGSEIALNHAFPGWKAYVGMSQQEWVYYDVVPGFLSGISLLGNHGSPPPIQGAYYVALSAGAVLSGGGYHAADVSISQSGVVPSWAKSLLFNVRTVDPQRLAISLNGNSLPHSVIYSAAYEPNSLLGADVTAFAGQTAELRLTVFSGYNDGQSTILFLDDFRFSTQAIPEPSSCGTWLLGLGILSLRRDMRFKLQPRRPLP